MQRISEILWQPGCCCYELPANCGHAPTRVLWLKGTIWPTKSVTRYRSQMGSVTKVGPAGPLSLAWYLSMALPSILISTILSERNLPVYHVMFPSICLAFISLTSLSFAMLGNAVLISFKRTPDGLLSVNAAWTLAKMMATLSMEQHPCPLVNCPSRSSLLQLASLGTVPQLSFQRPFTCSWVVTVCSMTLALHSHPCLV